MLIRPSQFEIEVYMMVRILLLPVITLVDDGSPFALVSRPESVQQCMHIETHQQHCQPVGSALSTHEGCPFGR
jgi:hypothetical protein